jgi:hypothetical protein
LIVDQFERCDPSGAKALTFFVAFMYGLKPVLFNLTTTRVLECTRPHEAADVK